MPELPEVETVARTLAPHIENNIFLSTRIFKETSIHPLSLNPDTLKGCQIKTCRRRAKLLILDLVPKQSASPTLLIAHLRMTGRLLTQQANIEKGKHTRCVFELQKPSGQIHQLFFDDIRTFGQILLANENILTKWPFWKSLGPEPLEMKRNDLAPRLLTGRPVKSALLDQKIIAGLGNIYADEALFKAGILPDRPANEISAKECGRLLGAIQAILIEAIEKKGSSIRDYMDADGKAGSFQKGFKVYGRGGEKCKKCGEILKKIRISGRSTVFCPNCQH